MGTREHPSAAKFLGGLLGTGVARGISTALGDALLYEIRTDILLANALVRGDVRLLAAVVERALDQEDLSSALTCALNQLALVADILDAARS